MARSEIEANLVDRVSAGRWEWSPPPRPVHSALSQWRVAERRLQTSSVYSAGWMSGRRRFSPAGGFGFNGFGFGRGDPTLPRERGGAQPGLVVLE